MPRILRDRPRLATALLLAVLIGLATWPLWGPGALLNTRGGGDSPFLLQRTQQLAEALRDGHFPARWMRDAAYGYGYPFFNFYAPLSIYLAAGLHLLGLGVVGAIQLSQLAAFAVAGWGAYALGRRWWDAAGPHPSPAGLLTAIAYTTAPFHLVNVYVRGDSLAEFWAMAFYPLTLLAADRLLEARRHRGQALAIFALAYAGLILCHNISALIFSPFLLLYLLLRDRRGDGRGWRGWLGRILPALALGLALAAWFWWPALAERDLAQLGPVTSGYFSFTNHFRGFDLVQGGFFFDYDVTAGSDPFRLGLVQALAALAGLVALALAPRPGRPSDERGVQRPALVIVSLAIALFMITPLSRPLWETLPLLPFTQFPWRFLSVVALAGALATGALARLAPAGARMPLALAGAALLLASALGDLRPETLRLDPADITPYRLAQYEWFSGNIGSTVSAEYLPPAANPRPRTSGWLNDGVRDGARVLSGSAEATRAALATSRQSWRVVAGAEGARLLLPTLFWPGWTAAIDGAPAPLTAAAGSGLMVVDVPPGDHELTLRLGRTPARLGAELVSLGALLLTLWLLRGYANRHSGRRLLAGTALLALLGLAARAWPVASAQPDDLTWDFARLAYLHHNPEGVPFANGARLAGYDLDADTVSAGEALNLTLRWEAGAAGDARLALVSPIDTRPEAAGGVAPAALVALSLPAAPGPVVARLELPATAPPGLYLPRLTFDDAPALTRDGAPRGPLYLRPVRVRAAPVDLPPPADPGPPALRLLDARVTPDALWLELAWWTGAPLPGNPAVSLRLTDPDGLWLGTLDTLPGYGFLPAAVWPAGAWTPDRLALPLAGISLPNGGPYGVVARLYEPADGRAWLTRRLGELVPGPDGPVFRETAPVYDLPSDLKPLDAAFGPDEIALRGYRLERGAESLELTLAWQALAPGRRDLRHFVHLVDGQTGAIAAQDDAMPRRDSYPTSQWSSGEIVLDPLILDLRGVPPGDYRLVVGLYAEQGERLPRVPAFDATGAPLPDDAVLLPARVNVPEG